MGVQYTKPISRDYECSGASWFVLSLFTLGVGWVLPFVVAFLTTYFWMKEFTYYEQADVTFLNKVALNIQCQDVNTNARSELTWASLPEAEELIGVNFVNPFLSHYAEDIDDDDKVDRLYLDISVPLPESTVALSVDVVYFFQWEINDAIKLSMETAAHLSQSSPVPMSSLQVNGDLEFQQRGLLVLSPFYDYQEIYNNSLFDGFTIKSPVDVQIPSILQAYGSRNESAHIKTFANSWTPDRGPFAVLGRTLDISLLLRNVKQPITHSADVPQLLKFGLIQYFTFWYIFTSLASFLKRIIIEGGFVNSYGSCPELDALKNKKRVY
ncbi:hypothetical protein DIPPA_13723 [Diplonema papillatum]|nr:hypothetical protein DIPPA_13723 [Diplonema papillatum]|eukprot:gene1889-2860_t